MNKRLCVYFLSAILLVVTSALVQAGAVPPTPAQLARAADMNNAFLQSLFHVSRSSLDTVGGEERDARWFLRNGADANARTLDDMPAICIAALHPQDSVKFFRSLVRLGANPFVQGPRGETPLSMALVVDNFAIAQYCQRLGVSR